MAIGQLPTVWVLGAGFCKSLGGPLLVDLFRQQYWGDLRKVMDDDLATTLTWVQAIFNHGRKLEQLWDNAEEFLAFIDSAYGEPRNAPRRERAIIESVFERALCPFDPSGTNHVLVNNARFRSCVADPLKTVRRALAVETTSFLTDLGDRDERWTPYEEWARGLSPERDTVITFNYDLFLDLLAPSRFQVVLPGEAVARDRVPVFKMHGSGNWVVDEDSQRISIDNDAIHSDRPIAIAAPGRSKAESVSRLFQPIWLDAIARLTHAYSIVFVGYSFPKTDAAARMDLLSGIERAAGGAVKQIEIVLGPDINRPESRRVLELLRHRTGHRRVFVDREPEFIYHRGEPITIITQHPLWAEDFVGDYGSRTRHPDRYPVREPPSLA
jgi:hypothetical protein